jgi:L-fuconolactonase
MKIDAHLHIWNLQRVEYLWPTPEDKLLYREFTLAEAEPQVKAAGIDRAILVQAAHSYAETDFILAEAAQVPWVAGVVGWVPLLKPDETAEKIHQYKRNPLFKGMRHLIHDEADKDWVVREAVIESLKVLASYDLPFDVVAVYPNQLKHVPTLSQKIPGLRMVIDHLAKPPLALEERQIWAAQMRAAAENPNVYAKISGLNTTTADAENWTYEDIKPSIDFAIETFGANRVIFGSDWPVALLAGTYAKVWEETNKVLQGYSQPEIDAILGGTAARFYRITQ